VAQCISNLGSANFCKFCIYNLLMLNFLRMLAFVNISESEFFQSRERGSAHNTSPSWLLGTLVVLRRGRQRQTGTKDKELHSTCHIWRIRRSDLCCYNSTFEDVFWPACHQLAAGQRWPSRGGGGALLAPAPRLALQARKWPGGRPRCRPSALTSNTSHMKYAYMFKHAFYLQIYAKYS
jgi:hypothetical protein